LKQPSARGNEVALDVHVVSEHRRADHQHHVVPCQAIGQGLPQRGQETRKQRMVLGEAPAPRHRACPNGSVQPLGELDRERPSAVLVYRRAQNEGGCTARIQGVREAVERTGVRRELNVDLARLDRGRRHVPIVLGD
jgi:hypothetical protein